jgi:hypothetical protein
VVKLVIAKDGAVKVAVLRVSYCSGRHGEDVDVKFEILGQELIDVLVNLLRLHFCLILICRSNSTGRFGALSFDETSTRDVEEYNAETSSPEPMENPGSPESTPTCPSNS